MQWRDGLLIVACLLLGPPLVSLVMVASLSVADGGVAALAALNLEFYFGTMLFAYILGWFPAALAGGGNAVASRLVGPGWRLLVALPVGAVPFLVSLAWLAEGEGGAYDPNTLVGIALGGALASLIVVAMVEAFGPPLRGDD